MPPTFAWFDHSGEQRRKVLDVIDLFKEQGTVDEMGLGTIRDAVADILFPGRVACRVEQYRDLLERFVAIQRGERS